MGSVSASREYASLKVFIFWKYQRTREPTTKILINVLLLSLPFQYENASKFFIFLFLFARAVGRKKKKKVQTWPQNEGFLDGFTGCQTFYSSFCETIIKQNGELSMPYIRSLEKPCILTYKLREEQCGGAEG